MWRLALPGRKQCLTQPCGPGKRTAILIRICGLTKSSPASKYSVHGIGRHKATMPNGLERNPYCDTIMYLQAVAVEKGKESIFLRQGKIHNHQVSYHITFSECAD